MSLLDEARGKINEIDREMARLFEERMRAVADVAKYKMEHGLPILDSSREREVIERNASLLEDKTLVPYYTDFLRGLMNSSREYQADLFLSSEQTPDRIDIRTERFTYPVHFLPGGLARLAEFFSLDRKVLILTDSGVPRKYAEMVQKSCKKGIVYTIPEGEGSKEFLNYQSIERVMVDNGFSRQDCLVAVGGGVVCDLGGFVASTYMRGIDFYSIPTTTLAMVDASVGGKCAINFMGGKNLIGAFYPPRGVLIDRTLLSTLPARQMASGLAEAIKMAVTLCDDFFRFIEECEWGDEALERILFYSVRTKARIVEEDEREGGRRKLLNFGHTLGHAIEMAYDGELTHGECVALGMLAFCSESVKERLKNVYIKFGLPLAFSLPIEEVVDRIGLDKKRDGNEIDVIYVEEVGCGQIRRVSLSELKADILEKYRGEGV